MKISYLLFVVLVFAGIPQTTADELELVNAKQIVAIENVCAWPNLTQLGDGTILAIIHNKPSHGGI